MNSPLRRREVLVNELHCGRTFTHSGSDPLHRAMAYVTRGEYSGFARLQPEWIALKRPAARPMAFATASLQVRASKNESMIVNLYYFGEPFRVGQRSNEDEERVSGDYFFLTLRGVVDRDGLKSLVSMHLDDRCA